MGKSLCGALSYCGSDIVGVEFVASTIKVALGMVLGLAMLWLSLCLIEGSIKVGVKYWWHIVSVSLLEGRLVVMIVCYWQIVVGIA